MSGVPWSKNPSKLSKKDEKKNRKVKKEVINQKMYNILKDTVETYIGKSIYYLNHLRLLYTQ